MVYDQDGNLIFEADAATGEMLREYVWLQGRPVAVIDAAADSTIYAVHVDHLDRPVMMTNHAGAIVWRADYLPFGQVRTSSGPAALAYRFPGQWFMLETGLHYNWHRWYDASMGRYTQPDPIGMPDGPNRYVYALNSPLIYTDPDGRNPAVAIPVIVGLGRMLAPWISRGAGAIARAIVGNAVFDDSAEEDDEQEENICPPRPVGIPGNWTEKPTRKGGGKIWTNPESPDEWVKGMPGDPESPYPNSQKPYYERHQGGQYRDVSGNPVPRKSADAHIPAPDFVYP